MDGVAAGIRSQSIPWRLVAPAIAVAVAVALYLPTLSNGFAWDDDYLVVQNPKVHSLAHAPSWFLKPWAGTAKTDRQRQQNALYWRPLTQASYALDWTVGGGAPWVFHLTNTLLHALATLLVYLLILALAQKPAAEPPPPSSPEVQPIQRPPISPVQLGALMGSLLFATHTVHTEAVALVTYRTTMLASVCVLAALYAHTRGGRRGVVLAAALYALGLMSKESALVLVPLALVVDVAVGRAAQDRLALARRYAGLALFTVGYLVLHRSITGPLLLDFFAGATRGEVALTMMKVITLYVRLMVVPYPLTPFYDWSIFPIATRLADPEVLTGIVLSALFLGVGIWSLVRRARIPLLATGLFGAALLPYLHLVPFFDVAGERFLYLPSAGACIGAGLGLSLAFTRQYRPALLAGLAVALSLVYGGLTLARLPHFDSTHSLLAHTARVFPYHMSMHYELGRSWLERGDPARAAAAFRHTLRINPDLDVAGLGLATALVRAGQRDEAVRFLMRELARRKVPAYRRMLARIAPGATRPEGAPRR